MIWKNLVTKAQLDVYVKTLLWFYYISSREINVSFSPIKGYQHTIEVTEGGSMIFRIPPGVRKNAKRTRNVRSNWSSHRRYGARA